MIAIAVMAYVTLARLVEMVIARRNTARLMAMGAQEHAPGHYPVILVMHVSWLALLWWHAPTASISWPWLAVFAALQPLRIWVMAALGARWTARIVTVPGETLVRTGPYRFLRHPNYAIVVGEIASLPLAFGWVGMAVVYSLCNAGMLAIRIRAEDAALAPIRR